MDIPDDHILLRQATYLRIDRVIIVTQRGAAQIPGIPLLEKNMNLILLRVDNDSNQFLIKARYRSCSSRLDGVLSIFVDTHKTGLDRYLVPLGGSKINIG